MKPMTTKTNREVEVLRKFFNDTYSDVIVGLNENDEIVVKGNILIWDSKYTGFPVKFHKLIGELHWSTNPCLSAKTDLRTLVNFPDVIEGNCHINGNPNLTSLEGGPKFVSGVFDCSSCAALTSLDGCPKTARIILICNDKIDDVSHIFDSDINEINITNTPVAENEDMVKQLETVMTVHY